MDTGIPWIAIYTCIHASLEYLLELHAYPLLYIGLFYFFFPTMLLVYFLIMELDPIKLNYVFMRCMYVCIGCNTKSRYLKTNICKPDKTIKSKPV